MWIALGISLFAFASDRFLKYLARNGKTTHHIENKGFAGGWIANRSLVKWISAVSLSIVAMIFIPQLRHENTIGKTGILLVLFGGASNVFDRLRSGSVTDMIVFPHGTKKKRRLVWNIADFMLLLGSLISIVHILQKAD